MQFFGSLLGRLFICLGIMLTAVGCVIGSVVGSSGGTTLPGVALIAAGSAIYWLASTTVCSQCGKRIKITAPECQHCAGKPS